MTLGLLDSMTATQELVVPRSIPTILDRAQTNRVSNWCSLSIEVRREEGKPQQESSCPPSENVVSYLRGEGAVVLREQVAGNGALLSLDKRGQHLLCVLTSESLIKK